MAPEFYPYYDITPSVFGGTVSTNQSTHPYQCHTPYYSNTSYSSCYNSSSRISAIKETKKEKRDRISKEKMLASWKVYNDKTTTVIQILGFCYQKKKTNV